MEGNRSSCRGYFLGKRPRVIGHRGSAGSVPENTLESFRQAVADGADVLETDVHLSADNEVIICHDATVDRTTNGLGSISSMTLAQLKELDAGYSFTTNSGVSFPFRGKGLKVPTLEEMLQEFPDMPLNVEIKIDSPVIVQKVVDLLRRYNRLDTTTVLVAAANRRLARRVRSFEPRVVTGHSREEVLWFFFLSRMRTPWFFQPKGPAMQVPDRYGRFQVVTPQFIKSAHGLGMEVHVWTINEDPDLRRYISMGVDAIFTDFPGRMRKIVDSSNLGD